MPNHNADQLGKSEQTPHQRTCASCAAPLPSLDEYHSAWCRKCELKPGTNWKARAEKAEEENKSLIVKKSARENLLMEALLQGSAEGAIFTGTALNDWLEHAKRVPPHHFVSFEDSLARETSFLARAEKGETEIEAQRLRLCRAGLVPSRHPTLAAAVDGALAIVTVLREHLADPPADVQIAVLEKMHRQDIWQQRIERKHPAPPSEQQELECLRRVAKEELLKVEARAEKAEADLRIQRELATQFEAGAALLIVRAEKAEAELAESNRVLAIHKRDFAAYFEKNQTERANCREELAKREKALEQAVSKIHPIINFVEGRGIVTGGSFLLGRLSVYSDCWPAEETPDLAEWLKQRGCLAK